MYKTFWMLYVLMGNPQHFPPTVVTDHYDTYQECYAAVEALADRIAKRNGMNGEFDCVRVTVKAND